MALRLIHGFLLLLVGTLASGCTIFDTTCSEDDRDCLSDPLFGSGIGVECTRTGECRAGLSCVSDGTCQPTADSPEGASCTLTAECEEDLICVPDPKGGSCLPAGERTMGQSCSDLQDCERGLVCLPKGLSGGVCEESGDGDSGSSCSGPEDCMAPLFCLDLITPGDFRCSPGLPLWSGTSCASVSSSDPNEAYFEIPEDEPLDEFYKLPFPNDIRIRDGKVDLSGHAVPPSELGIPVTQRYLDAAEELEGFATNPVVFFRFSHRFDFKSVTGDSVRIVDITPSSPTYDRQEGLVWKTTAGNLSNYICPHWLALKRPVGTTLRPATTYAAIVTTGVKPDSGGSFRRSKDLEAVLDDNAPSGSARAAAHTAYAPLRAWLADTGTDPQTILNAAVFTTQDPEEPLRRLLGRVQDDTEVELSDLTLCKSGVTSPCEDDEGRGACKGAVDSYDEIHGRISLPRFQEGTAPFLEPEDGGGIADNARIVDRQDICFALAVPKAQAPSDGWPLMIYGHGTGGSFTSSFGPNGLARDAAEGPSPAATLAIDLPQHGERRGGSDKDPEELFYNFLNPRAARDNVLQGSADLMSLVHWASTGEISAADSPTSEQIRFDASRILIFGHSQGATHAAVMIGHDPTPAAAVLSGVGGHLITSLLNKTEPVDIASVLPFAILDPNQKGEVAGDSYNPMLAIVQMYFERADPINFGYRIHREPASEAPTGHHLFMTYGTNDSFSPEATQAAYAEAADLPLVRPVLTELDVPDEAAPLSGNIDVDGTPRTVGVRQYVPPSGVDGHFVATQSTQGREDTVRFIEQTLAGEVPQIGE